MTITTKQYNDFSQISYSDRTDYNKLMSIIKEFTSKGGDVSLPVKTNQSLNSIELISFKDFITKNIEKSEDFFTELTSNGLNKNPFEMTFDKTSNLIKLTEGQGVSELKRGMEKHPKIVLDAFKNLISNLPNNYNEIKGYEYTNYDGNKNISEKDSALFLFVDQINEPEVYELFFQKYPTFIKEWDFETNDGMKYFVRKMDCRWDDCRDYGITKVFYKSNLAKDYINSRPKLLQDIIKIASKKGEIDFLNELLPNINLKEAEEGLQSYNLSLACAKDSKTAELLIKNGAIVETKVAHSGTDNFYTVTTYLSEEIKSPEVLDTILENYPKLAKKIKEEADSFYKVYSKKSPEFLKLLAKKYDFPFEKFDTISICAGDEILTKEFSELGMDVRQNELLCAKIVSDREAGLKLLRQLNKNDTLKSNSPEVIYNILNNSPTKSFLNYLLKNEVDKLEANTLNGVPAWWGVKNIEHFQMIYHSGINLLKTGEDNKPFIFNLFQKESVDKRVSQAIFNQYIKLTVQKDEGLKIDTNYKDKFNNNIFHLIFKTTRYNSEKFNKSIYDTLKSRGSTDIYELINEKNIEGKTPLELLLNPEINPNYEIRYVVEDILENGIEKTKLSQLGSDNTSLANKLKHVFRNDSEITTKVDALLLTQELSDTNSTTKARKMKI